ncbi:MAG TPA: hypothetical protein VME43_04660 [Bryobacteraceae bacterium]|nr:hypothetical protein [Bryobacteraceae bacterium]
MAGQIKRMIGTIIEKRAKGNATISLMTETKLILKGIDPNRYGDTSPDDPQVLARLKAVAVELGVTV